MFGMIHMIGRRFGRLVVESEGPRSESDRAQRRFYCRCDCGNQSLALGYNLRTGHTQSCGCMLLEKCAENARRLHTTHGMSYTPTHRSWRNMVHRCTKPSDSSYCRYGALGVTVCARWLEQNGQGFLNFIADVGERPAGMTLDRIENTKGYEPGNCRWATPSQQQNNRTTTKFIEYAGQRKSVGEWAKEKGINFGVLAFRVKAGWSAERALTEPVQKQIRSS